MNKKLIIISRIEDIDINDWDSFIKKSKENTVYQSFEMFSFWKQQEGHQPYVFAITENKRLQCICIVVLIENGTGIKRKLTRRAIIFGGTVFNENADREKLQGLLLQKMDEVLASKAIYIEVRNFYDASEFSSLYTRQNWKYIPYQNYKIALTDEEEVFAKFNSEKRRQIRKGLREGVAISYEKTKKNCEGIYNVIAKIYDDKVKKPLPALTFFEGLMQLEKAGLAALYFENKIIGGAFFLYDKNEIYDWYRGGLDYDYKKKFPSTIAAWAVMKYGLENNIPNFDFMGAGIKGEEYGVRKFKSQFGGELIEYGRYMKLYKPTLYNVGKTGLKLLKKLR